MYKSVIKKLLLFILTISGPIIIIKYLNITEIIIPLLLFSVLIFIFYLFCNNPIINILVSILLILFMIICLIIVPYSFYIAWFQIIVTKIPEGMITNIVVFIVVGFWSFLWGSFAKKSNPSLLLLLMTLLTLILSFIINTKLIYVIFLLFIISNISLNIFRVKRYEKFLSLTVVGITTILLSLLIFNNTNEDGSQIINKSAYNFRIFIDKNIPTFNLLSTIPGLSTNYSSVTGKPPILGSKSLFKITGKPGNRYYLRLKVGNKVNEKIISNKIDINKGGNNYIKLTVLADFLPIIPTTINTYEIDKFILPKNTYNTLKLSLPLSKGESIKLYLGNKSYYEEKPNIIKPISSNKIQYLAESLSGKTELQTVNNIRDYLFKNYSYSLDTEESLQYIPDFLFNTKEGFCIHFTRSFILLARLNGIITREISGYLVDIPNIEEDIYYSYNFNFGEKLITGKDSHLWPEIFINGQWSTFEVTPTVYRENIELNKLEDKKIINKKSDEETNILSKKLYYIFIIPLLLITLVLVKIFKYRKKYIIRLIKKSKTKGIPHPQEIGWVKWITRVTANKDYEKIILDNIYNKRQLTGNEILLLKKLLKSI